ncbi:MAG: hypothetical protein Q8P18_23395, partial [Pseudomonadota bacterium]|nr:hypothetical protein [Pseudomonadota bacterium]
GNSKVGSDLDLPALATAIGADPARVVAMNLDGTNAPIWYAVLKRRVYDQGHTPKLVVVYCTLGMMVQVELLSQSLEAQLARQLGTPDPVIDHKVFGQEKVNATWQRVLTRRTEAHSALLDGLRDGLVGLAFAPRGEAAGRDGTLLERGAAVAHPALGRVFGTDAMTSGERVRAVPVVEQEEEARAGAGPRDADATLIPDLIELAKSHGSEIVFVRSPMGSLKRDHDVVPRDLEQSVIARMADMGAAWVDLSASGPPDSGYGDGSHMNRSGRDRFMPKFIAALRAVGVGTGGPLEPAAATPSRPPPTVTRLGTPPTIPSKKPVRGRHPCDYHISLPTMAPVADNVLADARLGLISPLVLYEDGRRLAPHVPAQDVSDGCIGSSTHWNGVMRFSPSSSDSRTEGAPDPSVALARTYEVRYDPAAPLVGGRGEEAWWVYPGTTLRFTFAEGTAEGGLAAQVSALPVIPGTGVATMSIANGAELPFTEEGARFTAAGRADGTGGFTLDVRSPEDGPTLLLDRLALQVDEAPWYVIGTEPRDTMVDLLAQTVTYTAPPRPLAAPTAPPVRAAWNKDIWVFPVGALGVPPMEEAAKVGAACSVLRLSIDGLPAESQADGAPPNTPLARVTHSKDRLLVRFANDSAASGSVFAYSIDPARRCRGPARWLSPGDEAVFALPAIALADLRTAATALRLTGGAFPAAEADEVRVRVTSGAAPGERILDAVMPLARFADGEVELALDQPLPRDTAVEVRISSTGWLLLTYAGLAEAAPELFAAVE